MRDESNYTANIIKDYELVMAFAEAQSSTTPSETRRRSFRRQVPEKTPFPGSRNWGRDRWYALDSLPRIYRDMVNDDPVDPDSALDTAVEMWTQETSRAEAAMDRIVRYERGLDLVGNLPSWLKTIPSEDLALILKLKMNRLAQYEATLAEQREAREAAAKARAEYERRYSHTRSSSAMVHYTTRSGQSLDKVEVVDTRGLPPHLARELIRNSQPLEFTRHVTLTKPNVIKKIDHSKAEELDNKPPVKIHPMHVARGRNY